MLDEKDIKLIQKMISDSIASLKTIESETDFRIEDELADKENNAPENAISRITAYEKLLSKRDGETRKAKVIFAMSGGKASKGSQTTRITLPITWVREMGVTPDSREVNITFKDNKIIIERME